MRVLRVTLQAVSASSLLKRLLFLVLASRVCGELLAASTLISHSLEPFAKVQGAMPCLQRFRSWPCRWQGIRFVLFVPIADLARPLSVSEAVLALASDCSAVATSLHSFVSSNYPMRIRIYIYIYTHIHIQCNKGWARLIINIQPSHG